MTKVHVLEPTHRFPAPSSHAEHLFLDRYDMVSAGLLAGILLGLIGVLWIVIRVLRRPSANQKKRF